MAGIISFKLHKPLEDNLQARPQTHEKPLTARQSFNASAFPSNYLNYIGTNPNSRHRSQRERSSSSMGRRRLTKPQKPHDFSFLKFSKYKYT